MKNNIFNFKFDNSIFLKLLGSGLYLTCYFSLWFFKFEIFLEKNSFTRNSDFFLSGLLVHIPGLGGPEKRTLLIPSLGRQRQDYRVFKTRLGYRV